MAQQATLERTPYRGWERWHEGGGWLRRDLVAGLTVASVALPQAMAYALIAGIDPRFGLYTAIIVTALGSLFGSSPLLVNGPTNAISLTVFSAVAGLGLSVSGIPDDPTVPVLQAVFLLSLLVGVFQILIALLKLGDLTHYVSESVILGFMTGAGILVGLSQIPNLLGLPSKGEGHQHFLYRLWLTFTQADAHVSPQALGIGLGTIALVVVLRRVRKKRKIEIPEMLVTLVLASVVVWYFGWGEANEEGRALISTVGAVPRALPGLSLPRLEHLDWVPRLSGSALAIALLGLLEALAIAKSIQARTGGPLDYNRQCLAEGIANLGGGLFQCMPGSGSLTRSAINYQAGAQTRFSGVFAAVAVAAVLIAFAPLARHVPNPALAGMLLVTAWGLIDRQRLRFCFRATRYDGNLALATAFAAVFLSIEFSILIGTFLSFLFFVPRAARLGVAELVVSPRGVLRERQPDDSRCDRLAVFSLEGELFFGSAPELAACLAELKQRAASGAKVIVLRLKQARNPDMVVLEILHRFVQEMQDHNAVVLLCGVRGDFAGALRNLQFHHWVPDECVFLEDASSAESSTIRAVRHAYKLLGDNTCATCPRRSEPASVPSDWYYVI
jgi:SulP family sulfate permease